LQLAVPPPRVVSTSLFMVSVKSLPADSPRFMLPIPEVEMLYNKALTAADQNEFWRK